MTTIDDSAARARYDFDYWLFNDCMRRWWEMNVAEQLENLEGLS